MEAELEKRSHRHQGGEK